MKNLFSFKKQEIKEAFQNASFLAKTSGITLLQAPGSDHGKLLIITPKKIGTAVQRNKFRRQVKSIFYEEKLFVDPKITILMTYKQAVSLTFDEIKNFLVKNL